MRRWPIAVCALAWGVNANAYMTVEEFLRQAQDDARTTWSSEVDGGLYGSNSWIENAEVRYSDDNHRNNKQTFSLRLKPKGFDQRSAEDTILSLRREQRGLMLNSLLNEALKMRYEQLLDLLSEQSLVDELEREIVLTSNEVRLQRGLAFTKDFRPDDLLQLELHADQLRKKVKLKRERLLDLRERLHINRLPENIVSIDDMLAVLASPARRPVGNDVETARVKLKMAQQQRRLDRAKRGISLDLLELKYERADRMDDVLGMTLGIRIPFGGSFTNSERAYDVADAMHDLQLQRRTQQRGAVTESDMLRWQKMEADAIKATLDGVEQRIQLAMDSGNAEMLLILQRQQLEEERKLTDVRYRALRHFINYLEITGQLVEAPLRNWLIPGQPVL